MIFKRVNKLLFEYVRQKDIVVQIKGMQIRAKTRENALLSSKIIILRTKTVGVLCEKMII